MIYKMKTTDRKRAMIRFAQGTSPGPRNNPSRALLFVACAAILTACAGLAPRQPAFVSTVTVAMDANLPAGEARRKAIAQAELDARAKLLEQAVRIEGADGQPIEWLYLTDPFVEAAVRDAVRRAPVIEREILEDGKVRLSVGSDLDDLRRVLAGHGAAATTQP
jgi:hypothetical protein